LDVTGNTTVAGDTFLGNTTVNGTWTLNGDIQYIVSENAVYTDNLLEIHAPLGGVGGTWAVNDGKDIGLRFHYFDGVDTNAALIMDNGDWRLKWIVRDAEIGGQFVHGEFGDIQAANFYGNVADAAQPAITSVGTLTNLTVTNPITGNVSGNAGTATVLQTARTINGVSFNGSNNITVTADATTLSGTILKSTVLTSSLTSVGTLTNLTVTNPITGNVSGSAGTATVLQTARTINGVSFNGSSNIIVPAAASTLTGSTLATGVTTSNLTSVGTLTNLTVTNIIAGNVSGNSGTATVLQTARTINGVSFNGSSNITVTANASTLSGTTLNSTVLASSLTSVGTLGNLTVSGNVALQGITQIQQLDLPYSIKTGATGTVTHDCSVGQIFYHTSPSANFTANFTNLGLASGFITKIELYIVQGNTARLPTAVQIAGSTKTISWYGAVTPNGHANSVDVVSFTILLSGTTYTVFGKVDQYDTVGGG